MNKDIMKVIEIPLPSLDGQRKIVAVLDKQEERKSKLEQEIKQILTSIDHIVLDELGIDVPKAHAV